MKLIDITGKAISGEWGNDCEDGNGIPVLRTTNFTDTGVINFANVVLRDIPTKDLSKKFLRPGDIIIEKSGGSDTKPVGRVVYFDSEENKYLINNFTGLLRVVDQTKWYPRYVFYALFANYSFGGTRQYENKTTGLHNLKLDQYLNSFDIPDVDFQLQHHIADTLDKVSEGIEVCRKMLGKLDLMVKAKFVEMFGDVVQNSKQLPIKTLPEISENLDSRRIPITGSVREKGIYPYYGASGIVDYVKDYLFDEDILLISEDGANLLARSTPIAFSAAGKVWVNNHAHVLRFRDRATQCYVENFLNMIDISNYVTGTAQPKLNQAKLNAIPIPTPELASQKQFMEFTRQIEKIKLTSCEVLDKMETERLALMQEYFG